MALFTDMSEEELDELLDDEESNIYLDDPQKGMALIRSMLVKQKQTSAADRFGSTVKRTVFPIMAELELKNELEIYRALIKINNQIAEQKKIRILEGKKVLGVGGKFSAGKSSFINAISNATLPEGQRPTTSIATYIVNSNTAGNVAISGSGCEVPLDDDAMRALTHQFYEKYNIGFSRLIENLVVYTPDFTYPNIAILDTPGYSKADDSKNERNRDSELARTQLKAVDYLIWLVDATQGVITEKDLLFLDSLNVSTKILVIFTKADTEIPENLEKKIKQAKKSLAGINKKIYGIMAYNSRDRVTVIGEGMLEEYLQMINSDSTKGERNDDLLKKYKADLSAQLQKQITENNRLVTKYGKLLTQTVNIMHIRAMVNDYQQKEILNQRISELKKQLEKSFNELVKLTKKSEG